MAFGCSCFRVQMHKPLVHDSPRASIYHQGTKASLLELRRFMTLGSLGFPDSPNTTGWPPPGEIGGPEKALKLWTKYLLHLIFNWWFPLLGLARGLFHQQFLQTTFDFGNMWQLRIWYLDVFFPQMQCFSTCLQEHGYKDQSDCATKKSPLQRSGAWRIVSMF